MMYIKVSQIIITIARTAGFCLLVIIIIKAYGNMVDTRYTGVYCIIGCKSELLFYGSMLEKLKCLLLVELVLSSII